LQLKALELARDRSAIEKALENLPDGLDETYNRALLSINSLQERHAINSLKWLTFSVRPLRLEELAEASIINSKSSSLTEDSKLFSPTDVLAFLPGLIIVTEGNYRRDGSTHDVVKLAHFSVAEYLLSDRITEGPASRFSISEANAHLHIAESSLLYHLHVSEMESQIGIIEDLPKAFPLAEYAAQSWIEHAEVVPRETWPPSLVHLIGCALRPRSKSLLKMIQIWTVPVWIGHGLENGEHEVKRVSPLYYYAYRGYIESLSHASDPNSEELEYAPEVALTRFLVSEANFAMKHHEAVFELLLKALGGPEYGVVEFLVTYYLNDYKLISYPVPTCTLWKFWGERPTPDFNQETVSWSLKQMSRTATALHWIHNFGVQCPASSSENSEVIEATYAIQEVPDGNRHGEINSRTILWFPEETQLLDMRNVGGVLRIADLSLRRIDKFLTNSEDVRYQYPITYGAPEVEIERHSTCASDMWSLACGLHLPRVRYLASVRR
jgi:hypothetical protein